MFALTTREIKLDDLIFIYWTYFREDHRRYHGYDAAERKKADAGNYISVILHDTTLKRTHSCSPSIPCAKNWARCWRRAIIQHIRDDVCDNHWHIVWNVLLGMQHRLIEYLLSTYGKRRTRPNKLSDTNRSLARQMKVEKDTESAKFEGGYDKETLVSCGLLIEMRAKW